MLDLSQVFYSGVRSGKREDVSEKTSTIIIS